MGVTNDPQASEPIVEDVCVSRDGGGSLGFAVTVRHADVAWDHYVDRWPVIWPDGTVYGSRKPLHPHVDEQPFARSQSGIAIPGGIGAVNVHAGDNKGDMGPAFTVELPTD